MNRKNVIISLLLILIPFLAFPQEIQTLQAEDAVLGSAAIESDHSGYSGSGYVNFDNQSGSYLEWSVYISASGNADCTMVFANSGSTSRPMDILVNGNRVGSVDFAVTGGWSSWLQTTTVLNLSAGYNSIRLVSTGSEGGPNIDKMDIAAGGGGPVGTLGDVNGDSTINIIDALQVAQFSVGLVPDGFKKEAADVDCNNAINIVDALHIAQYYVGIKTEFSNCVQQPTPIITPIVTPVVTPTVKPSECGVSGSGRAINHGVKLVGYGSGTTGGGGSNKKTVSSKSALESALQSNTTIYVNGTISGSGMIQVKDKKNISVIGVGNSGKFRGVGLSFIRTSNIIVQNLTFENCSDDAINIENTTRVWVDHNTFSTSVNYTDCTKGSVKDQFDGQIDIKKNSRDITVSFNYVHDACKAMLLGFSDGKEPDNHVTYHHNRFENVGSRLPLIRHSDTHVYNNYYKNVVISGINVRMGANALIENNYFENVDDPILSADSDKIGYWNVSGNLYAPNGPSYTHSIEDVDVIGTVENCEVKSTSSWKVGYGYQLDDAIDVPPTVIKYAGAGKM